MAVTMTKSAIARKGSTVNLPVGQRQRPAG
jgi:hypothetical protein